MDAFKWRERNGEEINGTIPGYPPHLEIEAVKSTLIPPPTPPKQPALLPSEPLLIFEDV